MYLCDNIKPFLHRDQSGTVIAVSSYPISDRSNIVSCIEVHVRKGRDVKLVRDSSCERGSHSTLRPGKLSSTGDPDSRPRDRNLGRNSSSSTADPQSWQRSLG